jgi:site-specific DNA-methyltransferase (adenine-specific)
VFPQKLVTPCVLCGCPEGGVVLDPFTGSGTTAVVAVKNRRKFIGCEINPEYVRIAEKRIAGNVGLWNQENML